MFTIFKECKYIFTWLVCYFMVIYVHYIFVILCNNKTIEFLAGIVESHAQSIDIKQVCDLVSLQFGCWCRKMSHSDLRMTPFCFAWLYFDKKKGLCGMLQPNRFHHQRLINFSLHFCYQNTELSPILNFGIMIEWWYWKIFFRHIPLIGCILSKSLFSSLPFIFIFSFFFLLLWNGITNIHNIYSTHRHSIIAENPWPSGTISTDYFLIYIFFSNLNSIYIDWVLLPPLFDIVAER